MLDAETAWGLLIAGFSGTAYGRRTTTRLEVGPAQGVRFARGEDRPGESFDDFYARACDPAAALAAIAAARPLPEHYLTVLDDRPGLVAAYAGGGYRLSYSETLMVCDLGGLAMPAPDSEVMAARRPADADWLNANDPEGLRWIPPENLADPNLRHYAVIVAGRPAARGRSLVIDAGHSYVSRIYTAQDQRRRGLARALMRRLLADDAARGARWSVLMSSAMGAALYAGLGYRSLATTHIFEPAP